jgi:purine-nucleoside phosphorylase
VTRRVVHPRAVAYADVPGFPAVSVSGHAGRLVAGALGGRSVIAFEGRVHLYEGHSAQAAAFPVRVARALGAHTVVTVNAAGGINDAFAPGDIMCVDDHLNLGFRNPLVGATEDGDERFPDMSAPYDPALTSLLERTLRDAGARVHRGVYAHVLGPSYETRAEIAMLSAVGADAVGMSTVPEVITARACGMRVAGLSVITNRCNSGDVLRHDDVVAAAQRAADQVGRALERALERAW